MLLVVDPDNATSTRLDEARNPDWRISQVESAADAWAALDMIQPQCVVVELLLPDMPGVVFIERLHKKNRTPLIACSGRADRQLGISALKMGADTFIRKPFEPAEFFARLDAVLRRCYRKPAKTPPVTHVGDLVFDNQRIMAGVDGHWVRLTATEYRLLRAMAEQAGNCMSKSDLLQEVWGYDDYGIGGSHLVDVHLGRIRRKLAGIGAGDMIQTIRARGVMLQPVVLEGN